LDTLWEPVAAAAETATVALAAAAVAAEPIRMSLSDLLQYMREEGEEVVVVDFLQVVLLVPAATETMGGMVVLGVVVLLEVRARTVVSR
jgi:hypothetical protein